MTTSVDAGTSRKKHDVVGLMESSLSLYRTKQVRLVKENIQSINNYIQEDEEGLSSFDIKGFVKQEKEYLTHLLGLCKVIRLLEANELGKAYEILKEEICFFEEDNHNVLTAYGYEIKGNIERKQKEIVLAQKSFYHACQLYGLLQNKHEMSRMNYKIGVMNLDCSNYLLAEKYLNLSYKYAFEGANEKLKKIVANTLAVCYVHQKKQNEALNVYETMLKNQALTTRDSSRIFFNLGAIYYGQNELNKAERAFEACLLVRTSIIDSLGIANVFNNLGQIYIQKGEFSKARRYLEGSWDFALKTNNKKIEYNSSYNLLELSILTGNKDSALYYLSNYIALRDSIKNEKLQSQLLELDKKYKTLEKDNQIAQLQKEDALNQARLKTKNILITVFASFLFILFTIGYFVNKQRKELLMSRRRLTRQKEDITGMNEQLRVSNLSKDRILSVIGHDLRGPVGGLKELIELYMELPEYEPQDIDNLLKAAREASTSTYHLLENLLSWANSQRGEIIFNPVATPLLPLIKQTVQLLDNSINTRHVRFAFDIPQALVVNVDLNMLRTIIRNLVSNALKYSPENGLITISTKEVSSSLHFSVSDQGQGMTAEETQSIFKKKEAYFIGSEMTAKGTGLGLILCKEFVERHGGSIWIDSEKGVGTQVCFSIPVKGINTKPVSELEGVGAQ